MTSNFSNIYQSNIAIVNANQNGMTSHDRQPDYQPNSPNPTSPLATPLLLRHVNNNAAYDSYSRRNKDSCHEGTRTQHIHDITAWATSTTPPRNRLLWMHGPAGVGKTTIAQSCTRRIDEAGALGASFFFTRDNGVVDPSHFFTTLAYQISRKIRQYKDLLGAAICDDPTLLTRGLETQMKVLIVDPFLQLAREEVRIDPSVVFVDGLDECQDSGAQVQIVKLIAESIRAHGLQIPLLWAIFSRPEAHISSAFTAASVLPLCWTVELPVSRDLDTEIRVYLKGALSRQSNGAFDYMSNTRRWPSDRDLDTLVEVSAGLFIYAATLARFITDPDCDPEVQLRSVLLFHSDRNGRPVNPLADLDAFYCMILARIPPKIRNIIQHILLLHHQRANWDIEDLANASGHSLRTIENSFSRLYSVLTFKQIDTRKRCCKWGSATIFFHHASFMDFLMDLQRSREFCIDDRRHWRSLVLGCLPLLNGIQAMNGKGSRDGKLQKLEQLLSAVPDGSCLAYQKHIFALRNWLYEPIRRDLPEWSRLAEFEEGEIATKVFHDISHDMLWRIGPQIDTRTKLLQKFPEDLRIREPPPPPMGGFPLARTGLTYDWFNIDIDVDVTWTHLVITLNTIMSASGTPSLDNHGRCVNRLREFERGASSESIRQLNLRLEEYFSMHVQTLATTKEAEYAGLGDQRLLQQYMEQWSLYEGVVVFLQSAFSGTSAWNDSVEKLHSVPKSALSYWMLDFFKIVQGKDLKLTYAAINLVTRQRTGDLVEIGLIRQFIMSLMTLKFDHDPHVWHYDINDFRGVFLQATKEYYSAERKTFLAHNPLQSYLAFAMDRLSEELVIHLGSFFGDCGLGKERSQEREESAIACRNALVGDSWEMIYAEFEAQLALGDHQCLERIYYLATIDQFQYPTPNVNDRHVDRLDDIFGSHVKKTVLAAISFCSSTVSPEIEGNKPCPESYFALIDLQRHYSEIIKQAFDGDRHFTKLLNDAFDKLLRGHPQLHKAFYQHTAGPGGHDDTRTGASRNDEPESSQLLSAPLPASSRPITDNTSNQVAASAVTYVEARFGTPLQLTMGNTYRDMNSGQIIFGQNTLNQSAYGDTGSIQPPVDST